MSRNTADSSICNRRNALKLAVAAGGAAAAGVLSTRGAFAQGDVVEAATRETASAESPGWHRITLGEARITTVLDGLRPGDGPYPTFGADQSQEAMAELMRENFLP